jgi:hypothetical protein
MLWQICPEGDPSQRRFRERLDQVDIRTRIF